MRRLALLGVAVSLSLVLFVVSTKPVKASTVSTVNSSTYYGRMAFNNAKGPIFKSISIDKKDTNAGDVVAVVVDAEGSGSVLEGGMATWESPSGRLMYADLKSDSTGRRLSGTLKINKYAEAGVWVCASVQIYDEAGVITSSGPHDDLSAAAIRVLNDAADLKAPEVTGLSTNIKKAKLGDLLKVTLKASDDFSGIDSGFISWSSPGSLYWGVSAELKYNEQTQQLEAATLIPDESLPGLFTVSHIRVIDKAGNEFIYSPRDGIDADINLAGGSFTVDMAARPEHLTPPVIMTPISGDREALKIEDEDIDKPGIQITVAGVAVPEYRIRLVSGARELAVAKTGFNGIWKTTLDVIGPLNEIHAIAELPNGLRSGPTTLLTRGQAAKLVVKINQALSMVGAEYKGLYRDVPESDPYVYFIEAAKELGVFKGDERDVFDSEKEVSRAEFARWLYLGYEATKVFDDHGMAATGRNSIAQSAYHELLFHQDSAVKASLSLTGFPDAAMQDVRVDSWYAGYVYDLVRKGVISETGEKLFRPEHKMTRAEFEAMVNKVAGSGAGMGSRESTLTGITANMPISRAEAVKMVVLAGGYALDTTSPKYPDIFGHSGTDYIRTARRYNLISGYPDGMFGPENPLTRAEAAKLIWMLAKKTST